MLFILIFNSFKDFIYLFIRDREREAEIQAEGEKQAPCRETSVGLNPASWDHSLSWQADA